MFYMPIISESLEVCMRKFRFAAFFVLLMLTSGLSEGAININVSSSSCEIIDSDTVRVRFMGTDIQGYSSIWVDFNWDPNTYNFTPANAGTDTLSVVGDWMFTVDDGCNSVTSTIYLRLNSDKTIECTPTSAYDSSCKGHYSSENATGTWILSGSTLSVYISTIYTSQIYSNSKITGTLNGTVNNNGILDGKMYKKSSTTYDYTSLYGCFTGNRVTN